MMNYKFSLCFGLLLSFSVFALEPTHTIYVWTIPHSFTFLKSIMVPLSKEKCWAQKSSCYSFKESFDNSLVPKKEPKAGTQYLLEIWPYEGTRSQLKLFSFDGKIKNLVKDKIYFNRINEKVLNEVEHGEEIKNFVFSLNLK